VPVCAGFGIRGREQVERLSGHVEGVIVGSALVEVLERSWPPQTVLDTHTHSFGVWAQVSRGEMWLTVGERTQHLLPGAQFTLDPDVPHAERYGADGASYWVARRNTRP